MTLGRIAFLGSGETSLAGGRIFETLARLIPDPLRIAILETPAGFELNASLVAGRVGDFLATRLQNYKPTIDLIPARKKGTGFSPDNPDILKPLLQANMIFMGPGSPSYAARMLKDTLAWDIIRARHRQGATLVFASAATISAGQWVLPVYEIYKAGEDVHVKDGLGLFSDFGLNVSFVPHWNNAEGGADLDTSRCFMGMERFAQWCDMLPPESTTVGLDEHTGIIMDCQAGTCEVSGVSSVSIVRECNPEIYPSGSKFELKEIGDFHFPDPLEKDIPARVFELIQSAQTVAGGGIPNEVLALLDQRKQARADKDFGASDRLRDEISALGWSVKDTKEGQTVEQIS
jgi:hypothetical protein